MNPRVNDFSIQVATVNGSGSQSSNLVLMRALFYMGIPVSGKNIFPSNIAGLPTWYTIRATPQGYQCRKKEVDLFVAMNPQTVDDDLRALAKGGTFIMNEILAPTVVRDDVQIVKVPFTKLVSTVAQEMKLRKLLVNMVYVGVVAAYLGIDLDAVDRAIDKQFKGKKKAADLNKLAVRAGLEWGKANPATNFAIQAKPMNGTAGKIIIDGNAAAALGAVFGGVTFIAWYPITPSSSLCESAIDYLKRFRHDANGKATYAVVQAEDELASIGMVVGAGWAGCRAMTSTAGPGISLMAEFVGLAYYAEVPAVIWDVQRVGPSTGLPTRTAQGDVSFAVSLSHGDTKHIVLFPATVAECFQFGGTALDLAEEFQTPVFVLSDLDLGMNNWISEPFELPGKPLARGKVLKKEDLERLGKFERYRDVDGDGIPYRTIPGTDHPAAAYFTRGSGHNAAAQYTEKSADYVANVDRLKRKYETARARVPGPIVERDAGAKIGIIAFGTTHHAILESRDHLRAQGVLTDYLRVRALPLNDEITRFVAEHERCYVIEQNRDAQFMELLKLHLKPALGERIVSVLHYSGEPIDARSVTDAIVAGESGRGDARSKRSEKVEVN